MLKDLLMNRRSIRKYEDKKIDKEKIEAIIEGALTSPSGRNLKPAEIVVVEDEKVLKKLGGSRGKFSKLIEEAPLAFVIIGDRRESTTWVSDTAIMAIIVQLLAEEQGLKSCWVHVENREADDGSSTERNVREILNIPEYYTPHCIIAVGYPAESKKSYSKNDLDFGRIHKDKF